MKHIAKNGRSAQRGRVILLAVMLVVFLGGLAYALYPLVSGCVIKTQYTEEAADFLHTIAANLAPVEGGGSASAAAEKTENAPRPHAELYEAMQAYNEKIYAEGQSGLCDAWAYTAPSFDLAEYGIEDGVIGVISIPAIDVSMPIYLGASYDNMAKGAVHLTQTSLPLGGDNTNCVIAGHRGWRGAPFFLRLPELKPGDTITVTNLWETLTYTVTETKIIEPNDIDQILIQPGRDMLTLLTCHPYGSGGRYRYVVYCERAR